MASNNDDIVINCNHFWHIHVKFTKIFGTTAGSELDPAQLSLFPNRPITNVKSIDKVDPFDQKPIMKSNGLFVKRLLLSIYDLSF